MIRPMRIVHGIPLERQSSWGARILSYLLEKPQPTPITMPSTNSSRQQLEYQLEYGVNDLEKLCEIPGREDLSNSCHFSGCHAFLVLRTLMSKFWEKEIPSKRLRTKKQEISYRIDLAK